MATATLAPTKRSRAQITESQSIASGNPSQLNVEAMLHCVLAEAPSTELALRFAQLNSVYREMAAPTMLTQTAHLLSDVSERTPLRSSIPLVPAYMSQSALMNASARDVSWINLNWQCPFFTIWAGVKRSVLQRNSMMRFQNCLFVRLMVLVLTSS
jgi:hypothetical protein